MLKLFYLHLGEIFLHKENNKYVPNKEGGYGDKLVKVFNELKLEIHDTTKIRLFNKENVDFKLRMVR